tara:strand:- start:1772 stop:1882 length:111 start_codon:yes stop_codon:yes gene_type:complete
LEWKDHYSIENKGYKIKKPLEKEAFFKDIRKIRIYK